MFALVLFGAAAFGCGSVAQTTFLSRESAPGPAAAAAAEKSLTPEQGFAMITSSNKCPVQPFAPLFAPAAPVPEEAAAFFGGGNEAAHAYKQ